MQLTEQQVLEFQRLYKKKYQEDLSYDQAYSQCLNMMILGGIVYSPLTKQNIITLEKLKKYGTI